MDRHDYFSYWLNVEGSREDQEKVYQLLGSIEDKDWGAPVLESFLEPYNPDAEFPYASYCVDQDRGTVSMWNEDCMDETLHSIAVQVPNAILEMEVNDEDDQSYGFKVRYHGDLYQKVYCVTHQPLFRLDGDIPFDQRHDRTAYTEQQKTLYVLCEEFEGKDGIREFSILAMSEDKALLQELLKKKVEMDEYNFIADKGIDTDDEDHFMTNFENGFVEYYISEQPVYTQAHRKDLLASREFNKDYTEPFYFTFGSDGSQPYQRGWMEVHARDFGDALTLFRSKYPDKTPWICNCADFYSKEQFEKKVLPLYEDSPDWRICHEILTKDGSTYPAREEAEKKLPLEKQISAANDRREGIPSTDARSQAPSL